MFFNKKGKNTVIEPVPELTLTVPHSKHFRGYKRIKLATYKDPIAESGVAAVKAADDISKITFEIFNIKDVSPFIRVKADGNKIGTIWSTSWPDYFEMIKAGKCSKASVGFVDFGDVLLFAKFE